MWSKSIWVMLFLLLGVAGTYHHWLKSIEPRDDDFVHYWATTKYINTFISKGIDPNSVAIDKNDEYFYSLVPDIPHEVRHHTPLFFALFDRFPITDFTADYRLFHALSLVSYCFMIVTMLKLYGYNLQQGLILYSCLLIFYPKIVDAAVSSTNSLQLGILALIIVFFRFKVSWGYMVSGGLTAILVLLKPNTLFIPLILIVSQLVRQQWRVISLEIIGGLIGTLIGIFSGVIFFKSIWCWRDWLVCMGTISLSAVPLDIVSLANGNISLPTLLWNLTELDLAKPVLIFGALAVIVRVVCLSRKFVKKCSENNALQVGSDFQFDLNIVVSSCLVYLLFMRLVWVHYYTFAVPAIIFLLSPASRRSLGRNLVTVIVLAIGAIQLPLMFNIPIAPSGWLMYCGLMVLFIVGTRAQLSLSDCDSIQKTSSNDAICQ